MLLVCRIKYSILFYSILYSAFIVIRTGTKMSSKSGKKNLTKEEELLLQDFSRNVSTKSSALFYGNALIVSAIPMCELYFRVRQMPRRNVLLCGWGIV